MTTPESPTPKPDDRVLANARLSSYTMRAKDLINTKGFTFLLLVIVVVVAFGAGMQYGQKRVMQNPAAAESVVSNRAVPASLDKQVDFSQFWQVWDLVSQKYYDKSAVDPQKMVSGAIQGMVSALGDPYTTYLPPSSNQEVKDNLAGDFDGIGAELGFKDNNLAVMAPLDDTPASHAGIRAGDLILKIDGQDATGLSLPQAVDKIRGAKGTHVTLELYRQGQDKPIDVDLVRDTIHVKSVTYTQEPNSVGYIKISEFGDQTNKEWDAAVDQAVQAGDKSVVVDVRNNPGGYFESAIYIASEFIQGPIVEQQDGTGATQTFSSVREGRMLNTPVTVLINGGSASAAEIFSGAIQANNRGQLVGDQSFGKGTVQQVQDLSNGAGLHITEAKWLLPNGKWIHKIGLTPDVKVALTDQDVKDGNDPQLDKALSIATGLVK